MNVLSLFDGLSAGQLALANLGIKVNNYYSSEIDKHTIKVTQNNFPNTIQLGDIKNLDASSMDIDLLIGGSPCQGFSFAGKQLNFDDSKSKLFFEFVRILKETNPRYFLLENVKMKKEYQDIISDLLGVKPIEINSSLLGAQNRIRLYWTNIPNVDQPIDNEIYLKDVLENGSVGKEYNIDSEYFKGTKLGDYLENIKHTVIFNYSSSGRGNGVVENRFYESSNKKAHTLTKTGYSKRSFTGVYRESDGNFTIRRLTPIECERLQNFPDNYTKCISNSQRYKAIGNSWSVKVIEHIFKNLQMNKNVIQKVSINFNW